MTTQKPFFTRFLETQNPGRNQETTRPDQTMKFPSDNDEWWP